MGYSKIKLFKICIVHIKRKAQLTKLIKAGDVHVKCNEISLTNT